jgi:hypothetical protein
MTKMSKNTKKTKEQDAIWRMFKNKAASWGAILTGTYPSNAVYSFSDSSDTIWKCEQ